MCLILFFSLFEFKSSIYWRWLVCFLVQWILNVYLPIISPESIGLGKRYSNSRRSSFSAKWLSIRKENEYFENWIRNSTKLFDNFLGYYIYKKWIRNVFQIHFSAVISWNDFSPQVRTEKFTLKFISSWSCQLSQIAGPLLWPSAFPQLFQWSACMIY